MRRPARAVTPKAFHDAVLARFPEIAPLLGAGDEELPYLVAHAVVRWLRSVATPAIAPQVASRVRAFHDWALEQPRGNTASDDPMTIVTVGFVEHLFEHDETLPLIPRLMTRDDLVRNRDYLSQWVGKDRYEKALRLSQGRGK